MELKCADLLADPVRVRVKVGAVGVAAVGVFPLVGDVEKVGGGVLEINQDQVKLALLGRVVEGLLPAQGE